MGYQALYRVWRPQRFDEIVGQKIITQTLKNALITQRISHAYLFTGPRGTGKTSAAKIFSKAVNCRNLKDGEPCNNCATCLAINEGSLNDVIEIDAASNNGVEEIRDIRDKAKYAPTQADYKVYIIDEVHMLSTGAFNALLKTLEEPPTNVIFILATTEPHKIPATIISRTQRFDFKRIKFSEILQRMEFILKEKQVQYDELALKVIAKAAEGGMRDALSILDQATSYGDGKVTYDNALMVTGSVTKKFLVDYFKQIQLKDTKEALLTVKKLLNDGKDPQRFIEDLTSYCQDILLYNQAPEMIEEEDLGMFDDDFKDLAQSISEDFIYQAIDIINETSQSMRFTDHPDVYLEVLTVKLTHLNKVEATNLSSASVDNSVIEQLENQVNELKQALETLQKKSNTISETPKPKPQKTTSKQHVKINLSGIYGVLDQATRKDLNYFINLWPELMNSLSVTQRALMHVSKPVAASDDGIIVAFDYSFLYQKVNDDIELMDALQNGLDRLTNRVSKIIFVPEDQWPAIRKQYLSNKQPNKEASGVESAPKSDIVAEAENLFGSEILEIKND